MRVDFSPPTKRSRSTPLDLSSMAMLAAAKEKYGREIRVFQTSAASSTSTNVLNTEEGDDFYEFTAEDYYRLMSSKKEDKFLKTRKIREAEQAAHRSKMTKAVIRVRFPDNYTLEAIFHSSETLQSLVDLLMKVINHPEVPFYIYTTPPKKKIKDATLDFYTAGFVPGAIVYFSLDIPEGGDGGAVSDQYLKEEVMSLEGLEPISEQPQPSSQPEQEPVVSSHTDDAMVAPPPERKAADKKNIKPKWLKL